MSVQLSTSLSSAEWQHRLRDETLSAAEWRQLVRDGYNHIGSAFNAVRTRDPHAPDMQFLQSLIQRLPPGAAVLDVGCGAGVPITQTLAQHFEVTGVDFSATQLALARQNVPTATFLCQDMTALDLPHASFDGLVAYYAIIHVPRGEQRGVLREFFRVLKPGGLMLITMGVEGTRDGVETDWLGAPMYWSHFDIATNLDLVRDVGFEIKWQTRVSDPLPVGTDTSGQHLFVLAQKPE